MVRPTKICVVAGSNPHTTLQCKGCGKTFKTRDEKQGLRFLKIHMEKTHQALMGNAIERKKTVEEIARGHGVNKAKVVRH
jgi:predicted DCC family thiol-disulfide oxidoreductase YuxK